MKEYIFWTLAHLHCSWCFSFHAPDHIPYNFSFKSKDKQQRWNPWCVQPTSNVDRGLGGSAPGGAAVGEGCPQRRTRYVVGITCWGQENNNNKENNISCCVTEQTQWLYKKSTKTSSSEKFILNARQFQWSSALLLLRQACLIYKGHLFVYLMVSEVWKLFKFKAAK